MSTQDKNKKKLSGRFAIFITIVLFICTLIFLNNKFSSGSLRRIAYWIFNGVRGDATEATISFDSNEYNRFAVFNRNLCVVSPEKLSVYDLSGKTLFSETVLLRSPAISTSDSQFIVYDLGGLNYYVANSSQILFSGTTDAKILNAKMNDSGDFTIITDDDDCKTLVTAYDSNFEVIYKFHSSEKYIFDAALSSNNKNIAILGYGAPSGNFESTLYIGRTDEAEFSSSISLGDSMPLDLHFNGDNEITMICNNRIVIYNKNGDLVSETPFSDLPIKAFSQTPNRHFAVLLDNYQNGGNVKLMIINKKGETNSIDFEDDVYSISSSGKYISVHFSDKCAVYKDDLTLHCEFQLPATITNCTVNGDGSVISIGDNYALVYVK